MTDDKRKSEGARRSMVGAPPSARGGPSRTPRGAGAKTPTTSRKRSAKEVEEEHESAENSANEEESAENSGDEEAGKGKDVKETPKPKKRQKKRFLTEYTLKRKHREAAAERAAKLRRKQIEEGLIDEEEPEPEPEPEPEEEEEEPEPEMKPAEVRKYSSFQLLCDHLLRKLMAKDPEEYFAFPVTPSMAPDYHTVITNPMDFSAMRQKIEDDGYTTIPEMKIDAELIVSNALAYNHPNTVYHLAATRLSHITRYYYSEQYLRYIFHMLPFAGNIPLGKMGLTPLAPVTKKLENKRRLALCDDVSAKELIDRVPSPVSSRLSGRVPVLKNTKLAFLDNKDGATVLNVLGEQNPDKKVVKLIDIVGPLDEGTPGLFSPQEAKYTQPKMTYLDYGPFSSFAPQFDSTWAGLDKRDSDLLLRTYGDRANCSEVVSLRALVQDSGEHLIKVVDNLLDTLTDGEHSRTMKMLDKGTEKTPSSLDDIDLPSLLSEVETLENLGMDMSFVQDLRMQTRMVKEENTQVMLDAQGQRILDLAHLQHKRLSSQPPVTITKAQMPGPQEIALGAKVVSSFVDTVQTYAPPAQMVSAPTLHNAMGIQDQEFDMDILNEFFQ